MKIVVIGGSGLIGSKLVRKLREQGHEAVAASPNSGVNSVTGEGLAEALKGASVVVDVTNSPSWEDAAVLKFFETSTRNLLANEASAGVGHHVALSVVGTDRLLESGFFRAKLAQENLIKGSSIPYTIVRATQFFEFVKQIADFSTVAWPRNARRVDLEGPSDRYRYPENRPAKHPVAASEPAILELCNFGSTLRRQARAIQHGKSYGAKLARRRNSAA